MAISVLNQQITLEVHLDGCKQCAHNVYTSNNHKYNYDKNGKITATLPLDRESLIEKCKAVHR